MEHYIQRAIAGDEAAMQHIMTTYTPRLQAVAYSYVKQSHDAEDIVQQAFIQAFRALPTLREPAFFRTWLHKIVMRESLLHINKAKRLQAIQTQLAAQLQLETYEADYSVLYEALEQLKPPYQTAIMLHYFYHFQVVEIAHILDKPVNTIKMHLHRGRKLLRNALTAKTAQRVQMKDVKRMLHEQRLEIAKRYANVPDHYTLQLANYTEEGVSSYMWQGTSDEETTFLRVDAKGRLDDFAKTPSKKGARLPDQELLAIAKHMLQSQYPEAIPYYTHETCKRKDASITYTFRQEADGLPLLDYYCRVEVTHYGEVVQFTYTGYTTAPPSWPTTLYPPAHMTEAVCESEWVLRAEHVQTPTSHMRLLYTNALLEHVVDAVTGELLEEVASRVTYAPLQQVARQQQAETLEGMFHISDQWVRDDVAQDGLYETISWRPAGWQREEGMTYEHFLQREYSNRLRVKRHVQTGHIASFIAMVEEDGVPTFSTEDCLRIATAFMATYYERFLPYVQREETHDEQSDRACFRFVCHKDGYALENESFIVHISKRTGAIVLLTTPYITIEELEALVAPPVQPLHVRAEQFKVTRQWWKDDNDEVRAVYRVKTADGRFIHGIDAENGALITGK